MEKLEVAQDWGDPYFFVCYKQQWHPMIRSTLLAAAKFISKLFIFNFGERLHFYESAAMSLIDNQEIGRIG